VNVQRRKVKEILDYRGILKEQFGTRSAKPREERERKKLKREIGRITVV
jgi:hypothetical protein